MIDQEFVKYVVSALVNKPEEVRVERTVDERGVLLTLHVAEEDLGRVIGRRGSNAQSLRTLLRALGSKNEAHYNLKIIEHDADGNRLDSSRPSTQSTTEEALAEDNDFATDSPISNETNQQSAESTEDSLAQTKKELDDLSDDLL